MKHKRKDQEEIEIIAMKHLRGLQQNLLTDNNVDMFTWGYRKAMEEYIKRPTDIIEIINDFLTEIRDKADMIENTLIIEGRGEFTNKEKADRKLIFDIISHAGACMKQHKKSECP